MGDGWSIYCKVYDERPICYKVYVLDAKVEPFAASVEAACFILPHYAMKSNMPDRVLKKNIYYKKTTEWKS